MVEETILFSCRNRKAILGAENKPVELDLRYVRERGRVRRGTGKQVSTRWWRTFGFSLVIFGECLSALWIKEWHGTSSRMDWRSGRLKGERPQSPL